MNKIITDNEIRPLSRLIYLYLLEVKDPKISNTDLARAFDRTTVTISSCLSELAEAGYIKRGRQTTIEREIKIV